FGGDVVVGAAGAVLERVARDAEARGEGVQLVERVGHQVRPAPAAPQRDRIVDVDSHPAQGPRGARRHLRANAGSRGRATAWAMADATRAPSPAPSGGVQWLATTGGPSSSRAQRSIIRFS